MTPSTNTCFGSLTSPKRMDLEVVDFGSSLIASCWICSADWKPSLTMTSLPLGVANIPCGRKFKQLTQARGALLCYKSELMIPFFISFLICLGAFFRSRCSLCLEILALRQQLGVLKRKHPRRQLLVHDRIFWVLLRRLWPAWSDVLVIVRPETVVAWHRAGFRLFWRLRSRPKSSQRSIPRFELSSGGWRTRTLPGALREFTVSFWNSDSTSLNARSPAMSGACPLARPADRLLATDSKILRKHFLEWNSLQVFWGEVSFRFRP